jgi:hypothetical protein
VSTCALLAERPCAGVPGRVLIRQALPPEVRCQPLPTVKRLVGGSMALYGAFRDGTLPGFSVLLRKDGVTFVNIDAAHLRRGRH